MAKRNLSKFASDVESGRAISIQQPYIEEILRGKKKYEYRSRQTHIRGRVMLYASLKPGDLKRFKKLGYSPGELPSGLIVGSVEIVDCVYFSDDDCYGYKLAKPKRYKTTKKPKNQPQPCWFFPFNSLKRK